MGSHQIRVWKLCKAWWWLADQNRNMLPPRMLICFNKQLCWTAIWFILLFIMRRFAPSFLYSVYHSPFWSSSFWVESSFFHHFVISYLLSSVQRPATGCTVPCSSPANTTRFLSAPNLPQRLWGPHNPTFNCTRSLYNRDRVCLLRGTNWMFKYK
jgi:hypothetical protein